jgi:hypothetical protein
MCHYARLAEDQKKKSKQQGIEEMKNKTEDPTFPSDNQMTDPIDFDSAAALPPNVGTSCRLKTLSELSLNQAIYVYVWVGGLHTRIDGCILVSASLTCFLVLLFLSLSSLLILPCAKLLAESHRRTTSSDGSRTKISKRGALYSSSRKLAILCFQVLGTHCCERRRWWVV